MLKTVNNINNKINQCRKQRVQEHHRPNEVPISMNHTHKTPYSRVGIDWMFASRVIHLSYIYI